MNPLIARKPIAIFEIVELLFRRTPREKVGQLLSHLFRQLESPGADPKRRCAKSSGRCGAVHVPNVTRTRTGVHP